MSDSTGQWTATYHVVILAPQDAVRKLSIEVATRIRSRHVAKQKIVNVEELETLPARTHRGHHSANEAAFDDIHWMGKDHHCKISVSLF